MHLSVGIVHWNTGEDLRTCLEALRAHPFAGGPSEILVVDNGSTDGAPAMVRRDFPPVRLTANPANRGYAEATNQIFRAAAGARLLLLNPDARVTAGALDTLMAFLDRHPEAGLVAPKLVGPDGRRQESVRGFPNPLSTLTGAWKRFPFDYEKAGPAPQPMASCWLLTRAAWETVGPMDERFPLYFNDVDWCLRARRAGVGVFYTPEATVLHDHAGTTRRVRAAAVWESRRAWLRFLKKHFERDPWRPLAAAGITLDAWRQTGRWGESLGRDGGETTPEDWQRAIAEAGAP